MQATRATSSRALSLAALLLAAAFSQPALAQEQGPLPAGASLGTVSDREGSASLRRIDAERWELACERTGLQPGDWVKTATRGANALQLRFGKGELLLGPGALVELVRQGELKVLRGEVKLAPGKGERWRVHGPDGKSSLEVEKRGVVRALEGQLSLLGKDPKWLTSYESNDSSEAMGSLLAKVDGREVPLTMGYHKVTVDIRDQIARTTVEESFVNHTSSVLEGVFYFPLPADASISGFSMWIGNEQVHGEIVEKQRARAIYETILREKRDPGLLEWAGGNVFKARVYPIGHEKRIKITYTQVLPKTGDAFRYHYSLRSEMLRTHPLSKLELRVTLSSQEDLVSVTSPSHPGRFQNTKNAARFEYSEEEVTPERDFELVVQTKRAPGGRDTLIPHQRSDDGYFLALVDAPAAPQSSGPAAPIDVIVIADTSASVEGPAREALLGFCESLLGSLGPKDRFNLLTSDTEVRWAFDGPQVSTADSVEQALAHVEGRAPLGWTDLDPAFRQAFARAQANTQIVYVGDATNTRGDADPVAFARRIGALHAASKEGNVHVVQPGSKGEGQAMATLASLGVGSVRSLGESDPAAAAQDLLTEISAPKLSEVSIKIEGLATAAVYPRQLPNLPLGSQQIVVGRFLPQAGQAMNASIEVSADAAGKPFSRSSKSSFKTSPGDGNSFIPRLWARKHLDALLEEGRSEATKKRVIELSEDFQIITPYTSFLVLESDADRERFKVKKRFRMRDGESFFAKGRSDANYALKQKALKEAKRWRLHLRARVLERLEDMNRGLVELLRPGAAAQLKLAAQGETLEVAKAELRGGGAGGGARPGGPPVGASQQGYLAGRAAKSRSASPNDGSFGDEADSLGAPRAEPQSEGAPMPAPSADAPAPASPPAPAESLRELEEEAPMRALERMEKKSKDYRGRRSNRRQRLVRDAYGYSGGLSVHHAAELARLGFLPVEDAPPPPARWNGFSDLFPRLPLRAFDPQTLQPSWPSELAALLGGLDRGAWLQGQSSALEVTTRAEMVDHRGRTVLGGEGRGVLGPKGWANLPVHLEGDNALISWALGAKGGAERGALQLLWKTSRVRPAKAGDLADYPQLVPYLFGQAFLRSFVSYEVERTGREGDRVTLRFSPPENQRRYASEVEVVIDVARSVVLEVRHLRHGKLSSKTAFSDFVEVAGRHWPQTETAYDAKGKAGWVRKRSYRALAAPEAEAAVAKLTAPRAGATEIGPLPGLDEARQAVETSKQPRLEDRLVALSLMIGQQRWEDAEPQVAALFQSLEGAEAHFLFRATWSAQRRRLEELRTQVQEAAAALGEKAAPVEVARAQALMSWAGSLGPAEQLLVLQRLRPVFARQTKRLDPTYSIDQQLVNVLERAGRGEEAFRLREQMTKDYPFVAYAQVAFAQALAQRGEVEAAIAHLDERLVKGEPWLPHEAGQLREEIARQLWESVRYRELVKRIDAWDAAKIEPALAIHHYDRLLAALIMLDREDEVDERIAAWLESFKDPLSADLATWHRVQGSVNHLLGQMPGIPYYHRGALPPERQELLTKIASRLLSASGEQGEEAHQRPWDLGARILYDYRYRSGDASKPLTQELWAELEGLVHGKESQGLDTLRVRKLCEWLRGIGYAPAANREAGEGQPAAGWPKLFAAIAAHWKALAPAKSAADLQVVILGYAKRELQLDCRRRLLELAENPAQKRQRTLELYGALTSGPWSSEAEAETSTLFQTLSPPAEQKGEVLAESQNAWIASLHTLHDWVSTARGEANFQALPDRNQLDRRQVKAQRDALLREARAALRKRLQETVKTWPELLRPWLEVEALWLGAKLKADEGELLTQARTLLKAAVAGASAAKSSPATDLRWRILASRAVATQILLLADLEPTSELRKTHGQAFEELVNQAMGKKNELLDWREVLYCYLNVVNGQETLRKRLAEWFGEGKEVKERRWGRALAAVLVEGDDLAKAASILEALQEELSHEEWRRLADFYHVLDRRQKSRWAKVQSWAHLDEWRLQQGLQNDFYSKYQRRGKRVPEELDDEVPLRFLALLRKSSRPQNHVYVLRNYYSSTRDFRLLSCVPEAAIGQSAQGIYQLAAGYRQISNLLQEEATVDQLKKRLVEIREQAKTVTDQRALDLIDFLTALRAARQRQGAEQAGREALVALKRAYERAAWAEGEDRLWAQFLASQGRLRPAALAEEQLRQLKEITAGAKPGTPLHVELSRYLAQSYWTYAQRDRALQTLEASIEAARLPSGAIPGFAWSNFESRIGYLQNVRSYRQAETEIMAELPRPSTRGMARNLERRLNRLYLDCLRGGGEVSLGREEVLFQALLAKAYAALAKASNENQAQQEISQAVNLIRTRSRYREGRRVHNRAEQAAIADLRDEVTDLAYTRLPKVLVRFHHRNGPNLINMVGQITERVLGPLAALEFHVQRAENEPRWLRLCNWDAWPSRGWQIGELRRKADEKRGRGVYQSPLGKRLLALVLANLEEHLAHGRSTNQSIYYRNNRVYWSAAEGDYLRSAEAVVAKHGSRVEVLNRVCQYLWHGLGQRDRAITLLVERDAAGKLDQAGRRMLAGFLLSASRYGEAIPVYRRLIEERPHELDLRLQLVRCLHHTKQVEAGDAALAAAIAMLKEQKAWREHAVFQVGMACLETRRFERAEELIADAIKLRTRGRSNRGVGDGTLGRYYRELASARSALGNVVGAVDAAAGAIVAWGGHRRERQRALTRLERILDDAKDLGKYIDHLEAEVKETGLENPLLRRSIANVLVRRREFAAARDQLVLALEAKETDEVAQRLLIKCYDELGDPQAAAQQLLALARVQGHKPEIYVELGDRLTKAGDVAGAERAYTTLVEQQPNEAAAQGALAKVRERQRQFEEAAIHWTQWIRVRSDEPEGYIGLARSLILGGKRQAAQEPLEQLRTRTWDPRFERQIERALRDLGRLRPQKKRKGRTF